MLTRINFKVIPLKCPDREYKNLKTSGVDSLETRHVYSQAVELASVVFKNPGEASTLRLLNAFSSMKNVSKNRLELYLPSPKYRFVHEEIETYGGYYPYEVIHGEKFDDYRFLDSYTDRIFLLFVHQICTNEPYSPPERASRDDELFLTTEHAWKCMCPEKMFEEISKYSKRQADRVSVYKVVTQV